MIFDPDANLVISAMGWVDKTSLWMFDPGHRTEKTIAIEDARYLSLRAGGSKLFRIVHHHSPRETISIRSFAKPDVDLSLIEMVPGNVRFTGDTALWQHVDPIAIIATERGFRLVKIDAARERITDLDLTWYLRGNYDLGYQGLVDCMTVGRGHAIVSVQRSSELVVIDTDRDCRLGIIPLGDGRGNPVLTMRTQQDFLASNYDTLCRVDIQSLRVLNCRRLQEGGGGNMRQFIGEYNLGWGACAVARPFSGDVLRLEPETFDITGRASVDGQPLEVCMISYSEVVTRNWKTGQTTVTEFRAGTEMGKT